jgi:Xaa-Pro aminopeptidase
MLMHAPEARLASLRQQMKAQGLDGFVIPMCDEHMSEYVGAYAQRLEWLTGFGGSAGTAVVLADSAAIFVDGRYTCRCAIRSTDGSMTIRAFRRPARRHG